MGYVGEEQIKYRMEILETERQEIMKIRNVRTMCLIVFVASIFLSELLPFGFLISFGAIACMIISSIKNGKREKEFTLNYKREIIKPMFSSVITNCEYYPDRGIERSYLRELNAIDTGDNYRSEDLVKGYYKNVSFSRSDVEIEEEHTDSEGHTHTTTTFQGQWQIFEFNKLFKSNIQVVEKGFGAAKSQSSIFTRKENRRQKVSMENSEFNKRFRIYANSEQEAFYILTPHLMEAIMKLADSQKAGKRGSLMLFFDNNKLNVALDNRRDSFEPSYKKGMEEALEETINEFKKDMKSITDFVDYLQLDNDLYR